MFLFNWFTCGCPLLVYRNATRTHPYTMHKNKLKMAERIKYKIRHHLTPGREHRQNIFWHQPYEYFLRSVSQSNRNKSKNKPMVPNQTDKFCTEKETKKKAKRHFTEWEKIVSSDATDKGLISKIYKQFIRFNCSSLLIPFEAFWLVLEESLSF